MNPVLYDVTPLLPKNLSGVGVYTRQLYLALKSLGVPLKPVYKGSRVFKKKSIEEHIQESGQALFSAGGFFFPKETIVHGTDFVLPLSGKKFKTIVTIHDLAVFREDLLERDFCSRGQEKIHEVLAHRPDHIIVPSKFVQGELIARFPDYKDKVSAVYHGCDHLWCASKETDKKKPFVKKKPYFLYVGHFEKRKNILGLVKAFEIFCTETPNVDLVLVGKDGFAAEEIHQYIHSSTVKSRIHKLGHVDGDTLNVLYQRCRAFVYPSFYEGFGMPIIEAMGAGVPVMTAKASSTAEVAGQGAHLVDPHNLDEMADGLCKVYEDKDYRKQLIASSQQRAREFSWQKTAQETLQLYKNL